MGEDRYFIQRHADSFFSLYLDGIKIPLLNEVLWHGSSIPDEILQLCGEQFEFYKKIRVEAKPLIDALYNLYASYHCSGSKYINAKHVDLKYQKFLLETDFLSQTERAAFTDFIDKTETRAEQEAKREDRHKEPTFIYLMKDERTELIKIGRSLNPAFREKTLQSDNPMIVLLCFWQGKKSDEKILHEEFKGKRFRGEWFELSDEDIQAIKGRYLDE